MRNGRYILAAVLLVVLVLAVSAGCAGEIPTKYDLNVNLAQGDGGLSPLVRERIGFDSRTDSYFYNGADMYMYSDDHATQVLHLDGATGNLDGEGTANFAGAVTLQSTLTGEGAVTLESTLDAQGNVSDSGGVFTVADNVLVDGQADAVQLTAQGFTTQTNSIFVVEQSDGTDVLTVSNDGNGDFLGTLQYGANNLYPVGHASSGLQAVYGTAVVTGTATAPHGLTTVTFCLCTMGEDPTAGGGDGAMCTVVVSANVCTLKVWQDDFVTAATETDVDVHWLVIGTP